MSKTVHVRFSNHADVALTRTGGDGAWTAGFEAPDTLDAQTAGEWQTGGDGAVTYTIGDSDNVLSLQWTAAHGGGFSFELSTGWELLGTVAGRCGRSNESSRRRTR